MFQKTQEPLFGLRLILCKFTQVLVWFFRIPENTEDSVDVDFYLAHFRKPIAPKTECAKPAYPSQEEVILAHIFYNAGEKVLVNDCKAK